MNRLRAMSMDSTVKSVLGEPGRLSAMWISLLESPHGLAVGKSRNVRSPLWSGVPILSSKLKVPSVFWLPEACNTFPVGARYTRAARRVNFLADGSAAVSGGGGAQARQRV